MPLQEKNKSALKRVLQKWLQVDKGYFSVQRGYDFIGDILSVIDTPYELETEHRIGRIDALLAAIHRNDKTIVKEIADGLKMGTILIGTLESNRSNLSTECIEIIFSVDANHAKQIKTIRKITLAPLSV